MKVIQVKIEAGISGLSYDGENYTDLNKTINDLIVAHPNATFFGVASGESMEGVGIFDGDLLVVDRSIRAKHGDVIVATYNNSFVCKLFDENKGQLKSANPKFKPVTISELDRCTFEGVVTSSVRMHRRSKLTSSF